MRKCTGIVGRKLTEKMGILGLKGQIAVYILLDEGIPIAGVFQALLLNWVKEKKSSPKSLSAGCRYTVSQLSTDNIQTVN